MFGDSMEFADMNSTVVRNVNLNQHFIPCTYAYIVLLHEICINAVLDYIY